MKKHARLTGTLLCFVLLCAGLLLGCSDDNGAKGDPSLGYIVNSTSYRISVDLGLQNKYKWTLGPGEILRLNLDHNRTHVISVIFYNNADRVGTGFSSNFYIDGTALDNTLRDFLCSWYFEIVSTSGFGNKSGS